MLTTKPKMDKFPEKKKVHFFGDLSLMYIRLISPCSINSAPRKHAAAQMLKTSQTNHTLLRTLCPTLWQQGKESCSYIFEAFPTVAAALQIPYLSSALSTLDVRWKCLESHHASNQYIVTSGISMLANRLPAIPNERKADSLKNKMWVSVSNKEVKEDLR